MDRAFFSGASASPPAPPSNPSVGYPMEGNPSSGTPATKPGPYWYHQVTEEILAVIIAAGITPTQGMLNQLATSIQSGKLSSAVATGTADAITATYTPAVPSLTNGIALRVRAGLSNTTTTPTFSPNGLPAKIIVKGAGSALTVGDIAGAGHWIELQYDLTLNKWVLLNPATGVNSSRQLGIFYKTDSQSVAFLKTGASTLQIKAGTVIDVNGVTVTFAAATSIVIPMVVGGTDYTIYACTDGTVRADSSLIAPTGYTIANSRQIGGFHYGLTAPGSTVASGSFATTGTGMIWVQADVDDIAGINKFSLWDLKWRPTCSPRGMRLEPGNFWLDIYYSNTDVDANGTSKYNTNIASGTVLPKIPAAFGGNGVATYPALNWWVANELAASQGKRLPWEFEFAAAAYGVTENQSIDATTSTYPTTQRNAGYTSKRGGEQMSGHHWIWGQDSSFRNDGAASAIDYDVNGTNGAGTGRGQVYLMNSLGLVRALFGGARTSGATSGSRASLWFYYPWNSYWGVGLRAACDHLILV